MKRRDFITKAGLVGAGTVAASTLAAPAIAQDRIEIAMVVNLAKRFSWPWHWCSALCAEAFRRN